MIVALSIYTNDEEIYSRTIENNQARVVEFKYLTEQVEAYRTTTGKLPTSLETFDKHGKCHAPYIVQSETVNTSFPTKGVDRLGEFPNHSFAIGCIIAPGLHDPAPEFYAAWSGETTLPLKVDDFLFPFYVPAIGAILIIISFTLIWRLRKT